MAKSLEIFLIFFLIFQIAIFISVHSVIYLLNIMCFILVVDDGITPAGCASGFMGRRRTDLMPTIPNRESSALLKRPFIKSPGRTLSLTRLDQLAKPRKPRLATDLPSVSEKPKTSKSLSTSPSSMSRSMSHLAVSGALNKNNSRSLHALSIAPAIPIKTNRAVQLRARQHSQDSTSNSTTMSQGKSSYP